MSSNVVVTVEQQRNLVSDKVLSSTEAAYSAGFLDGEGTLVLSLAGRPANRSGFRIIPMMMFANTHREGLLRIREILGNGRLDGLYLKAHPNHKPGYRLWFSANQIRHLLPQLRPYLMLKGPQADVMLAALGLMRHGHAPTLAEWSALDALRAQLQTMNHRGVANGVVRPQAVALRPALPKIVKRTRRVCSVKGCGRAHSAKGYCHKHYVLYVVRAGGSLYERACANCGRAFVARYANKRYCSKVCADGVHYQTHRTEILARMKASRMADGERANHGNH